ncbi:MAG: hypothetical protein QNL70_08105, partial [Pseudomonas sp.]
THGQDTARGWQTPGWAGAAPDNSVHYCSYADIQKMSAKDTDRTPTRLPDLQTIEEPPTLC